MGDQVVVWRVDLDQKETVTGECAELLSYDETQRADRYRLSRDRNRFVTSRGILRQIIGNYLAIKPKEVRFDYGRYGKPRLDKQHGPLRFNISHSRGLALFAFASGREVGVDVEYQDQSVDLSMVARYVFDEHEIDSFRSLSSTEQITVFYRRWTQKEALAKAMGLGLSDLLNTNAGVIPKARHNSLTILPMEIDSDHVAALAAEKLGSVEHRQWPQN
jgi:4'-phosphopantetheinyl transferase